MSSGQLLHRGVVITRASDKEYKDLISLLESGFKLDPYFHPNGRPLVVEGQGFVWFVLDEVALENLEAYNPLPEQPEEPEPPQREVPLTAAERVLVDLVDLRQLNPEDDKTIIDDLIKKGYIYTGKWKGLIELSLYQGAQTLGAFVPYCPDCKDRPLLTPQGYPDAIQGYTCPECGNSFPIHYDFKTARARQDALEREETDADV
jgi:hypothetical protein